jgi:hypothetical protein
MIQSAAPQAKAPAIASEAEATAMLIEIGKLMTELCEIVDEETTLVRTGRLTAAAMAAERKGQLAGVFMTTASRVRASTNRLARTSPRLLDGLRQQHEAFRAKLQTNLTALATARAVSEGILRGVSNELARRSTVQTYGASGRRHAQARPAATPIAFSRCL